MVAALLTLLFVAPQVPAAPQTPPPAEAAAPGLGPEATADYQIGPGDILKITAFGHEDLGQTVVVQTDGTFIYPLVGRVKASDMSARELERKLALLLSRGFIRNPQVTVLVQEFRSKTVYVVGEVARPGPYPLSGRTGLLEVLAKTAITSNAGAEVIVVRPAAGADVSGPLLPPGVQAGGEAGGGEGAAEEAAADAPPAEVFRVNLREIQEGDLSKNIPLQPNDTVFVPQAAKVFVTGEVRSPGAYAWFPGMTSRQLISMAGGVSADGSDGRLRIVRPPSEKGGKTVEGKIKLDEPVKPGETLVVRRRLF